MPAFIKTKGDEKRWAKAKKAANKTHSESEGDSYWAIVNSIYQKMTKSEIENIGDMLRKARDYINDDPADYGEEDTDEEEPEYENEGDDEGDEAAKWLAQNDPGSEEEEPEEPVEPEEENAYEEYTPDEDDEAHRKEAEEAQTQRTTQPEPTTEEQPVQEEQTPPAPAAAAASGSRFPQPSPEELAEMRRYTRPWTERARDRKYLEAQPEKNPVMYHQGKLVEARNLAHRDRQAAHRAFQEKPEYANADPITQMEMEAQFDKDWHEKNPDYLNNAVKAHEKAHEKGQFGSKIHAAANDEQIEHILSGGAQPETPMSAEEAAQHVGGVRGEEGEGTSASFVTDPATSFARGNQDFLREYAKHREARKKLKAGKGGEPKQTLEDLYEHSANEPKTDVAKVLGEHPDLKDPAKKAKFDKFFQQYYPLIGMNAKRAVNKMGLQDKDVDYGTLHEAGMHGLVQAINDYDPNHPSKASFSHHAGNKIRGLMQTAMKANDQIPAQLRAGAKRHIQLMSKHPPEVADRARRVDAMKASLPQQPKKVPSEGETNG